MAGILINPGGAADRESIKLATSKNTTIPNWRRKERAPEALREAMRIVLENHPGRSLRSLTATYNCIGMIFANRRTCIEPEHVPMILSDDRYVEVRAPADVKPGDLVIYHEPSTADVSHVALVVSNTAKLENGSSLIIVLSQWGSHGEYFHDYRDVPEALGRPDQFYSERRRI